MTMKKFSEKLTFESSNQLREGNNQLNNGRQRLSVTRLTAKMSGRERENYSKFQNMQPLDTKVPIDYANGLSGVFMPIKNDFSVLDIDQGIDNDCCDIEKQDGGEPADRYCDEPHWPRAAKRKVKRVRFVICTLALFGFALGVMSRLILNVSIVEMVKKSDEVPAEELVQDQTTTISPIDALSPQPTSEPSSTMETIDELILAATTEIPIPRSPQDSTHNPMEQIPQVTHVDSSHDDVYAVSITDTTANTTVATETGATQDDGLRFAWSKQDVNIVLGSFYMGYVPGILFSGSLAQTYGAKYPLFLCIFGSAVINLFTPLIAQFSLNLLIASRVMLGIIQGSLLPCLYELFNRWLTQTESSIFAPMIKVSMPMGSLIGTIMPGILASFKLDWPTLFYIGGFMCLVWSIVWLLLATSLPQTNRFVGINELNRIMRKKKNHFNQPATITEKVARSQSANRAVSRRAEAEETSNSASTKSSRTPWLLIITSPSVLALTVVKFTYNIGMDFIFLQLAVYLREVHKAPIETISAIASGGYCMQMLLISFVGWLAKVVVINRACGLSVTKWRKIFQGSSNFIMAFTYLILAYTNPGLEVATVLLMSVCFWWMMGAGGESMLPYDLSGEYPASIVGFAHSISIISGIALTAVCGVILGEDTENPEKWSLLFYILAGLLAGGGLVFVVIVKAKPFLPGEKTPKAIRRGLKSQQQQQIKAISTDQDQFKSNKSSNLR